MKPRIAATGLLGSLLLLTSGSAPRRAAPRPGLSAGATLLPNGWRIAPAGRHISLGDLPLAMAESPDGRYLAVLNSGYAKPTVALVDLEKGTAGERFALDNAWLGLAWHPAEDRLYVSAGSENAVRELLLADGKIRAGRTYSLGPRPAPSDGSFVGSVALAGDGKRLYAVNVLGQNLTALELPSGRVARARDLPAEPYGVVASRDGRSVYVSLWGGAKVLVLDAGSLEVRAEVAVGEHPNDVAESADGARLFVACANTNSVWVIDLASSAAREQISLAPVPGAPPGSTPNGLALSADGRTLLVANADNNAVAVVDVSRPGASRVAGFLPTGWYPTAVRFTRDGKKILVLSGKGLTSQANPRGPQPGIPGDAAQYVGALLTGSLSILSVPSPAELAAHTRTVSELTPRFRPTVTAPEGDSAIPTRPGERSPIRHVFYVIRENRTYDQVLGDVREGNGDPGLCLFGEDVTPNAHALAREFVLFDNFYVNAEVSYDGHSYSTAAYATDFVEKTWPMLYADRGGQYLIGEKGQRRNPYGNITAPEPGFIWDACVRAGVTVRSYGEFAVAADAGDAGRDAGQNAPLRKTYEASVPGLQGRVAPDYPPYELTIPDARRFEAWLAEFRRFEADGTLPALSILHLPSDHTAGARPGMPTPRAMIAENDVALGRLVETISKSRYWKDSAIFVIEDDAQNGPDHVDAHRSVLLVASPFARRGLVDSNLYTTCGVLRTIELVLGIPPMSQCDAAATPLTAAFRRAADATPFRHRAPRVSLDEKNGIDAYGAARSLAMDLSQADRAPDLELSEIVWRSVRGASSPMPPPVRAAFVRPVEEPDEERNGEADGD